MGQQVQWPELSEGLDGIIASARKAGLLTTLNVRSYDQHIAVGDGSGWSIDQRGYATLGVQVRAESDSHAASISRSYACTTFQELVAALPGLIEPICDLRTIVDAACESVPCPRGEMPVILDAGHAAVFFHEVCGHPLEGDIVASGTSYLAPLLGERVAEEYLTVLDDPTAGSSKVAHVIDDEGIPSRPAYLIERGIVREPLLDQRSARLLKLEPNGHARRLNYRHYPIPRMTHTRVAEHAGTLIDALAGIERGLFISKIKIRHMNIASGDFSFIISEARLIEQGQLSAYVGPGLLRGNGLQCLHSIDFVGSDETRFLNAEAGCGKLDQWPLVVSFGQPTIRFRKLTVEPW
jgi:TldD protein